MTTRFDSLADFMNFVKVEYALASDSAISQSPEVRITHCSGKKEVVSILHPGLSEGDLKDASRGGLLDKLELVFRAPYAVSIRYDVKRVFLLARRKHDLFGARDVAFYDLALTSVKSIDSLSLASINPRDTGEKGFINTFNHITAQAFVTSLFSEEMANFIADAHERYHLPELITGDFTDEMLDDPHNNPLDNYVDIVNNEWGQEIGKMLRDKYGITRKTKWTPHLLCNYLNDLQAYYSWSFQIGMEPYNETDELVLKFSRKLNRVMSDESFDI